MQTAGRRRVAAVLALALAYTVGVAAATYLVVELHSRYDGVKVINSSMIRLSQNSIELSDILNLAIVFAAAYLTFLVMALVRRRFGVPWWAAIPAIIALAIMSYQSLPQTCSSQFAIGQGPCYGDPSFGLNFGVHALVVVLVVYLATSAAIFLTRRLQEDRPLTRA